MKILIGDRRILFSCETKSIREVEVSSKFRVSSFFLFSFFLVQWNVEVKQLKRFYIKHVQGNKKDYSNNFFLCLLMQCPL